MNVSTMFLIAGVAICGLYGLAFMCLIRAAGKADGSTAGDAADGGAMHCVGAGDVHPRAVRDFTLIAGGRSAFDTEPVTDSSHDALSPGSKGGAA